MSPVFDMGRVIGHLSRCLFGCLELKDAIFRPIQLRPELLNFSLGEAQPVRNGHDDLLSVAVSWSVVSALITYAVDE